uniref:Secreted protein n=2 Tax=Caenorhabditis japonica TaxID=281687 RepID=A0A8R1J0Y1_CAEJA
MTNKISKIILLVSFLTAVVENMEKPQDSKNTEEHPAPEHLPGANMIGGGRGARIHKWKSEQQQQPKANESESAKSAPPPQADCPDQGSNN